VSYLFSRVGAVAAAVAAVIAVPAASASALAPPPSSPGPTGPDLSLFVSTNSVVATATLSYSGAPPAVILDWGDGTSSRPSPPTASLPGQPVPGAGRVVFQHAYEANGGAVSKRVSLLSTLTGRELLARTIVILPRYRVTQQAIEFSPLNHCDSVFEDTTEWEVFTDGGVPPYKDWRFDRHTADRGGVGVPLPDFGVLPDSAVSVETTAGHAPRLGYSGWEEDPVRNDFFDFQYINFEPLLGSRSLTLTYQEKFGGDCRFQIRTSMVVELLKPGLVGPPVASQ
jgi:hypothetical protein